jgi:hypothetical protein
MTKTEIQNAANKITKEYDVPKIGLVFTDRSGPGLACYVTLRYKIGGKISKKHIPKNITVYQWSKIQGSSGQVAGVVGHELAHHIFNMKKNSLQHTNAFYNLEEKIAVKLSRMLR